MSIPEILQGPDFKYPRCLCNGERTLFYGTPTYLKDSTCHTPITSTITSKKLFDVCACMGGGELVYNIQSSLIVCVPDIYIDAVLKEEGRAGLLTTNKEPRQA